MTKEGNMILQQKKKYRKRRKYSEKTKKEMKNLKIESYRRLSLCLSVPNRIPSE